ncbi:unnamed protein product [Mytilus edulis]|uniref:BEN domain-containing protein n=1 Tax=Mytilus edulis TaxID=6550 RepID=A0A8S3QUU9_MYTED|nr:unnamed protein product [Mytilus edulis]
MLFVKHGFLSVKEEIVVYDAKKIKKEALVSDQSSRVSVVLYQDLIDKVEENGWYIFRNLSSRLYRNNFFLTTTLSTEITKIDDITDDVSDIMLTASLITIHATGYTNWNDANRDFMKHEQSDCHLESVKKMNLGKSNKDISIAITAQRDVTAREVSAVLSTSIPNASAMENDEKSFNAYFEEKWIFVVDNAPLKAPASTLVRNFLKSTPGNVILTGSPPSSDEEQPPPAPEILTPQPPAPAPGPVPVPTPSPIAPNNIFPDDHRIYRLFDVMISGQSRLFAMMTNFDKRLKAMETEQHKLHAKQDSLERLLTQRQATPGLLAVDSDNETDEENTVPADMIIPDDRLIILKDRAHSAGNFASILLKELMPHLFGQENLGNMYNWNGGGINAKREVCPRAKLAVRQYVNHYYPECRKEETFRNVVVHKVNEALRRPSVKACRRRILETPNANE